MQSLIESIKSVLKKRIDEPRKYLGASAIGNSCHRAIWYSVNYPEYAQITERQRLTFEIGHRLESMIIDLLIESGLSIIRPYTFVCRDYPIFQGNSDFAIVDESGEMISLGEIKTAKDDSFKIFVKKGLRLWYPEYYDQVQSYMGMSGIDNYIVIALNKDTSELHEEFVEFDQIWYECLVEKAKRIGESKDIPDGINNNASFFKCKICFYTKECHGQ